MSKTSPLREFDLIQLLAGEPELLAIADALVETQRERRSPTGNRWRWRPALVTAVVVAALAGAGVAIAAGFGAFDGIGAAQHPQTGADVLDAKTLAMLQEACPSQIAEGSIYVPLCHLDLESARLIGEIPAYGNVYVVTNTRGELCSVIGEHLASCGPPLSNSQPISFASFNDSPTTGGTYVATGIALDGVTSVSFTVNGEAVTAPVKNNVWVYEKPDSHAAGEDCIVANLADGSTVTPFPEVPCP